MWQAASEWLGRRWWGLIIAYVLLLAFTYALVWSVIEPLGIPDTFNSLPDWMKSRVLYHVVVTLLVTPHILLVMERASRRHNASQPSVHHPLRSRDSRQSHRPTLVFSNASQRTLEVVWLNHEGAERSYGTIDPNGRVHRVETFATHPFVIKDHSTGERLLVVMPLNETDLEATIIVETPPLQ